MADEDEAPEVQQEDEAGSPPELEVREPDPRDAELTRLRDDNQRMLETLTRVVQQPPAHPRQQTLQDAEPDFSDADEYGLTPAQMRAIYSKVSAGLAPKIERVARIAESPRPKSAKDHMEDIMLEAGVQPENRRLAKGIILDKAEELEARGINPLSPEARSTLLNEVRLGAASVHRQPVNGNGNGSSRTAGVGGGSLPPGQKPKVQEKRAPSMMEVIKTDQKKRGLY